MIVYMCLGDGGAKTLLKVLFVVQADGSHEFGMGILEEAQIIAMPSDGKGIDLAETQSACDGEFQRRRRATLPAKIMMFSAHGYNIRFAFKIFW